ncbi:MULTISPECIES: transposase [unclassified Nonomuraea]|uniref:transposase n=1 Tax=unclassified Nonomuraea TaxID=2593643 RepID=UPI00191C580D|nr:transposase [Nonomuraea sp. KC401]
MNERKPYPSDLSDEQWALIESVITAWKAAHRSVSGHQGKYAMRAIVNAIFYQGRTGVQWDYLPHDLPPSGAVYYYFAKWRDDGTAQKIHDLLRWHVRERKRRLADPSLVVLDTQSVRAAAGVPATTTGRDAAKKVPGRKRGLAVDVFGLVIAVVVLAASAHDNVAGDGPAGPGCRADLRHGDQGPGRPGLQEHRHRPWRQPRDRRGDRPAQPTMGSSASGDAGSSSRPTAP